ncbi:MAG: 3-ketoacyl-ACP reductase [Limnochordia bacterium]|jgi:3-oxoacyl-[acyl-carrier protein] reductase
MKVSGRIALVTGGSRGIGRGIALGLAEAGFGVAVGYARNSEAAQEVVRLAQDKGVSAAAFGANVGDDQERGAFVEAVLERFGRIDILVNNAGVAPLKREDILTASEESFDRLASINLKAPFFLTQRVARHMIDLTQRDPQARPKIINIGSVSAYAPSVNRGDYCISKAGLSMVTKLFAARLAEYGILVYELRGGIIATDMTSTVKEKYDALIEDGLIPIRRWGTPEDFSRAVVAIASDALPYSTGEVINVDGGFHLQQL